MFNLTIFKYLAILAFLPAFAWAEQWPTASGTHFRLPPSITKLQDNDCQIKWKCDLKSSVTGSPVLDEQYAYVGTTKGDFYCINRDEGSIIWVKHLPGPIISAAELADDSLFISCVDGFVYALSLHDGKIQWKHRVGRPVLSPPLFKDDIVYIGDAFGRIRALNSKNGRLIWQSGSGGKITAPMALSEKSLYYADESGSVFCRSIIDGALIWEGKVSGCGIASPVIYNGLLIVPMMSKSELSTPITEYLTAWDMKTGTKVWTASKPGAFSVMSAPTVSDQIVWCFTVEGYMSDGTLRGFNVNTGQQVVERRMGRLVVDAALISAGDELYLAGHDGKLHIFNSQSGLPLNEINLGSKIFSSPALSDGKLFIGCQNGYLYCIE